MSYKLEVTGPELSSTLRGTLAAWASQEHDLHLVTREGYRVFTHRALLALHSRHLRRVLLDDPVLHSSSSAPASVSVPASAASISALLRLLTGGEAEVGDSALGAEVTEAAAALGVTITNLNTKRTLPASGSGITVVKLPAKNASDEESDTFNTSQVRKPKKKAKKVKQKDPDLELLQHQHCQIGTRKL